VALVGTNGSGKSTLLKTLIGLLDPIAGQLEVLGADPGDQPRRVGYLGQFHTTGASQLPLRARDVVLMGRYPRRGLLGRITRADRDAVAVAMERLDVAHLAGRPLRSLSGGQARRVHLAQAVAREADLLVLDEPTAGLDAGSTARYRQAISGELARGAAVVVATHDIADALTADQALLLAGRVVATGPARLALNAEHLMEAFGIALHAVPHSDHQHLLAAEAARRPNAPPAPHAGLTRTGRRGGHRGDPGDGEHLIGQGERAPAWGSGGGAPEQGQHTRQPDDDQQGSSDSY
jgi:ABC-type Mn2+/Zn2+ transport system ATPase subunit